jgi:hypothetical protein
VAEEGEGRSGLRWLASPLPVAGLLLMALNDHWWRQAWPNALTFKLSDFGVLLYFPALLCALWSLAPRPWRPRPLSRSAVLASCALSGLSLAALNLSPAVAQLYGEALEVLFPGRYSYTPDPSDCVALVVVPIVALSGLRCARRE